MRRPPGLIPDDAHNRALIQNVHPPSRRNPEPARGDSGREDALVADARERGLAVDTLVRHLREVDRARTDGETEGFVKVQVRRDTDRIVGATIVARRAGEMIGELTLASVAGIGLDRLAGVLHPYPTQAEAVRQLADQYRRRCLTPFVRAALGTWLRWTR